MNFEQFVKSKSFLISAGVIAGLIVVVLIFSAGVFVGLEKAKFSYNFGQSYVRNFGGPARLGNLPSDRDFINAHGSAGQIIKISGSTITIKDQDGVEKNIIANAQTAIRDMRQDIKITDLQINDYIVAIGSPDSQGQVNATLIRVLPSPAAASMPAPQLMPQQQ